MNMNLSESFIAGQEAAKNGRNINNSYPHDHEEFVAGYRSVSTGAKEDTKLKEVHQKIVGETSMRDLVLQRIRQLQEYHNNFNPGAMRWRTFTIAVGMARTEYPIAQINFHQLEDHDLLTALERILRRHYTQM